MSVTYRSQREPYEALHYVVVPNRQNIEARAPKPAHRQAQNPVAQAATAVAPNPRATQSNVQATQPTTTTSTQSTLRGATRSTGNTQTPIQPRTMPATPAPQKSPAPRTQRNLTLTSTQDVLITHRRTAKGGRRTGQERHIDNVKNGRAQAPRGAKVNASTPQRKSAPKPVVANRRSNRKPISVTTGSRPLTAATPRPSAKAAPRHTHTTVPAPAARGHRTPAPGHRGL